MLGRGTLSLIGVALFLASCSDAPQPQAGRRAQPSQGTPAEVLLLGSHARVTVMDPATGSPRFSGAGALSLGDWSKLFTATPVGGQTVVREFQAATGETLSTTSVDGDLAIRVVSSHGGKVALMAPLPAGTSPWTPQPRAFTDIVVADPAGHGKPIRLHLKGNFEPEAFSRDGASLFLIRFLPPTAPRSYQVAVVDLAKREVYAVLGRKKTPVETMSGTRLEQVASSDGTRLYTLYSSQPPAYAKGHDAVQARASRPVAFVHTLSMDGGWAVCVGLPKAFWGGDPAHEALAVSPGGRFLYVVDTERGVVAVVDTEELAVVRTARLPIEEYGRADGVTEASVSPDGSALYVADGERGAVLDSATLGLEWSWVTSGPIAGMAFSSDGRVLYAALPGVVEVLDVSSGRPIRMIRAEKTEGIEFMATLAA